MLTKSQIDTFRQDGFLVVRDMYDAEAVGEIARWCEDLL